MLPIPKNIKSIFLAVSRIKSCALMIDLANQLFFTEEKVVQKFIAEILNEYVYCRGE